MPIFLGNQKIGLSSLGSIPVSNIQQIPNVFLVTDSVQMFFDASDWNGSSSTLLGRYSNSTASLSSVTVGVSSSLNFTTSSTLTTTASAVEQPIQATTSTIFAIYASSGSEADWHGRLLNSIGTNWLFGTYGGSGPGGGPEKQYAYFNNQFVIESGSYDTNWHMMVGIRHNVSSASIYIDNVYKTGSLQSNSGFSGLVVNKGQFIPSEFTQANIGVFGVYNKELSPNEITQIYQFYQSRFGL